MTLRVVGQSKQSRGLKLAPLTSKNGSGSLGRTRTCDPEINSLLLYQLSYQGMAVEAS